MHKFNMIFVFHFYILGWSLGFEPTLQLKGWNSIALQIGAHMRTSILNTDHNTKLSAKYVHKILRTSSWELNWVFLNLDLCMHFGRNENCVLALLSMDLIIGLTRY